MMRYSQSIVGGIFCFALLALPTCNAAEPSIIRIEEDWEMVVNDPDVANVSPQVTFFASPSVHSEDSYFQLQMNYAADDGFSSGGFHVAAVRNGQIVDEARSVTRTILARDGDQIRWTNLMAMFNNRILFAIKNGHGHDWGDFGGPDYLVELKGSTLTDLTEYHPQQSLDSVDIGYGKNRVESVTLREVRVYYQDGRTVIVPVNSQL